MKQRNVPVMQRHIVAIGSSQKEYTNNLFEEIVENSKQIKQTKK